jgi:uncharacterized protein involved in exopolysaccharide biosynthesis
VNPLYVQTFRRRRRLFLGIVIVSVAVSTWMTAGAPKMYRSAATIYADARPAQQNGGSTAANEQTTLNELLTTRFFRDKVAQRASLRAYFKSHTAEGWGPGAIVSSLRGGGGSVDARIAGAFTKRVTSAVLGPHVLLIAYDAPSPALARKTLQALVAEYRVERVALPDESLSLYRQQLQKASAAASAAHEKVRRYLRLHPGSDNSREVRKLEAAERAAMDRRADASAALQLASSVSPGSDPAPTVRVMDGATLPGAPTAGRKKLVKAILAGLFAGLLVSGLGVVALTKAPQLVRGESDAADLDLDFAGMSDAELARLIHDMDEEWATANDGPPDDLHKRRKSSA